MVEFVQHVIGGDTHEYVALTDGMPMTLAGVQHALEREPSFATSLSGLLAEHAFAAYFWETPVSTTARLGQPFRFVIVRADALTRTAADSRSFATQIAGGNDVVDFDNLGGDARLVVPCPLGGVGYPHLAAFVRAAPEPQQLAFWQRVGACWRQATGTSPRWVSTAGLGVPWLHVRIDQGPKYYRHAPYRAACG